MKNFLENIEKLLIFLVFLSFPFMDAKTFVFGIPLYLPEVLVLSALAIHSVRFLKKDFLPRRIPTAVASAFMLLGAVSSMIVNGVDRDALGAIKSWFLFPMLFSWLVFKSGFSEKDAWRAVACWFFGVAAVASAALVIPSLSVETYDGRLRSAFPSPNHFGFFLEYGAILGVGLMVLMKRRYLSLSLLIAAEGAVLSALLMTGSAGASISVGIASLTVLVISLFPANVSKKILGIMAILAVSSVALAFFLMDRDTLGSGETRSSLASRVMIWNAASRMIAEHPIFGVGPRNFQEAYLALQSEFPPYLEWAVPHPHNILLSFWLFTGVAGLFGFVSLLAILFRRVFPETDGATAVLPGTFFGLLVALCLHGLVDTPYFRNDLAYAFWATTALTLLLTNKKDAEAPKL